jgi:WhiB family redox-sensing transcriptional regulator
MLLVSGALRPVADRLASHGACRGVDPDLFFPVGSSGPALLQAAEAKAVCAGCPVRDDCLSYAIETGQSAGVWGGTSEEERRVLRSAQATGAGLA